MKWLVKKVEPRLQARTIKQLTTLWALERMWAGGTMPTTPDEVAERVRQAIGAAAVRYGCDGVDALNAEASQSRSIRADHGGDWEDFMHHKKPDAPPRHTDER